MESGAYVTINVFYVYHRSLSYTVVVNKGSVSAMIREVAMNFQPEICKINIRVIKRTADCAENNKWTYRIN